ncbi:hypothetical protein [Acaryochloris sp. CCMEE 5410]|uniref:hypothetical protein n=1 Tax=Acaryochloris sp. CCMEE 5410 TaxID=310037 RepID=UPI0021D35C15|nr:hypothetical protein [Acaryochloris sp. CCMEE 5410]
MSLQPHAPGFIPEETIRVAHAAFPKGNVFMALREEIGTIYTDQDFSAYIQLKVNLLLVPGA